MADTEIIPLEPTKMSRRGFVPSRETWKSWYYRARLATAGHKEAKVTAFQFICFIAGLVAIALMPLGAWAIPAAMLTGSLVGIIAAERQ